MTASQVVPKQTNVDLPESVKVCERYVKGNVKGRHVTIELLHSVEVHEGHVKIV